MMILGLNVGSNAGMVNGRGWVSPTSGEFVYLPIPETEPLAQDAPTYRELGFHQVAEPDLPVHLDPEFQTFTYGHKRRFGDARLWKLQQGDLLFFYATLDVLPDNESWGVYVIGYFEVEEVVDVRKMGRKDLIRLPGFARNAHLKQRMPVVSLLVRGGPGSRLFQRALRLSRLDDVRRLEPWFAARLSTVTGKAVDGGRAWWRWLLASDDSDLAALFRQQPSIRTSAA